MITDVEYSSVALVPSVNPITERYRAEAASIAMRCGLSI